MVTTKKLKIAITGGIGSGKSEFAKLLSEKGYLVINVDELSKKLLVADKKLKDRIINTFGSQSYEKDKLNNKFLAEKVFSDPAKVIKINSIVHPVVKKEVNLKIEELLKNNNVVFVEAALIYEADMEDMFDYVVLVTADENIRMQRKIANEGYTEEQFYRRNENQIPDSEKKKRADFIFENNGSLNELKIKTDLLSEIIKGL